MLYFAYGSNLNHQQMTTERCPRSSFDSRAYMDGYKVVFDGRSERWNGPVANIISDQSERVWGGLFKITDEHLLSLDKNEGYPKTYNRKLMQVTNDAGARIEAWVYLRNGLNQGT